MSEQKLIGMIGGTSCSSTILYYDTINQMVREKLGGTHSARIALYSIDYAPLRDLYYEAGGWDKIPGLLHNEFKSALKAEPDCLMLCCNSLHKAFDQIEPDLDLRIPFFHPAKLSAAALQTSGIRRALLLGNLFTMEDGFFAKPIQAAGIEVGIPDKSDHPFIHEAQTKLAAGKNSPEIRTQFSNMLRRYHQKYDGVVLACTELPMAIDQNSTSMKVINPLQLQCKAAVSFALGG